MLQGKQLGRYLCGDLLESGGMSEIYLAKDTYIDRQVAIKVIRTEMPSYFDPDGVDEAVRLFQKEAQAIILLDHPHILPLLDYGEEVINDAMFTYIVMPFRQEGSLTNWLRKYRGSGLLSLHEVTHFLRQAADALQYAHDHEIVHRDVKPSNFLIFSGKRRQGLPDLQLADFGVAKFMYAISTTSQTIRGTPIYMAPEQWRGEAVPATDQYALAIMVYELLAGRPPFRGENPQQVLYKHLYVQPQAPSAFNPRIPAEIDVVLMRALLKKPADRFDSISEFAQAFQHAAVNGGRVRATLPINEPGTRLARTAPAIEEDQTVYEPYRQLSKSRPSPLLAVVVLIITGLGLLAYSVFPNFLASFTSQPGTKVMQSSQGVTTPPGASVTSTGSGTATSQRNVAVIATEAQSTVTAQIAATSIAATATATVQSSINATATVTAYNAIIMRGTLAVNDPLQDNSQDNSWDVTTIPGGGGCAFTGGAYHSTMPQQSFISPCFAQATDFKNFSYQVQVKIAQGDQGGTIFRADSQKGRFYYFSINRNGKYALDIYDGDILSKTLVQGSSSAINTGLGQSNLVVVVADGNNITLYVNMQKIASVTDSTYSEGQIGVIAEDISNPTDVAFNNAGVWTF